MSAGSYHLTRRDGRTLALSSLGGALEFYDFIIFVFFIKSIEAAFFPAYMEGWLATLWSYGIFAAGYLVRPVGGIIMAHFGDLYGRKRMFTFSVLLMALATLGMAFVPAYNSIGMFAPFLLLFLRLLQGAAIGGEVPGAWTFVAEHVPSRHVGLATGVLTSGLSLGILLGSLVAVFINSVLSVEMVNSYGWRLAFVLGGVLGLVAVWLRRWLDETPVFKAMKKSRALNAELPLKSVMTRYPAGVVVSMLLTWCLSAAIIVATLMTANLLEKFPYGYSSRQALWANCITCTALIIATPFAGYLCSRWGGGRFFILGGIIFSAVTAGFYSYTGGSVAVLFVLSALLGLATGFAGAVAYVMVRTFPAAVRFTGLSFSYNVAYAIFGGLTPVFLSFIQRFLPMAHMWYLAFIGILVSLVGGYLLFAGEKRQLAVGVEERES
ncbi:MAG: Major facilitator transporter protein [Candidatus Tokpelaia hoelldobleri]|uniref:Major facilitator transporter protein n=1 Tax=Candidatus Tokpelaia hoelldobleri TaxID=1902579 RepID=A0A1U9JVB8_9HYPH|nr:MAG: Major facilitator transporter protein [Candidatus Tokpelaia hoelldoblerii]